MTVERGDVPKWKYSLVEEGWINADEAKSLRSTIEAQKQENNGLSHCVDMLDNKIQQLRYRLQKAANESADDADEKLRLKSQIEEQAREIERLKARLQPCAEDSPANCGECFPCLLEIKRQRNDLRQEITHKDQTLRALRDKFLEYAEEWRGLCSVGGKCSNARPGSVSCPDCQNREDNEALAALAEAAIGEVKG